MENINIAGSGKISGGEYAQVKISGSGRVLGNIRCTDLRSAGSAHVEGDVECAGQIKCAGSFRCDGRVQADELHVSGSCTLGSEVRARVFKAAGSFFAGGRMCTEQLSGAGRFTVDGDIEGDEVKLSGSVKVNGLLNAERLHIRVGGDCRIEGDSVTLQNTEADVVRGREVVISSGCKIGCVEYSVSLKVEDDGQVGERRQV